MCGLQLWPQIRVRVVNVQEDVLHKEIQFSIFQTYILCLFLVFRVMCALCNVAGYICNILYKNILKVFHHYVIVHSTPKLYFSSLIHCWYWYNI